MTAPNTTTPDTPAGPTPAAMPASVTPPAASQPPPEPSMPEHEGDRVLDESGWHPDAIAEVRKLRRESQRLRDRARTAEEGVERAAAQLGAMHHAEAERIAADLLIDPTDLWSAGTDFTDPETGEFDPNLVAEAARGLIADKPHLARPQSGPPPSNRPVEGLRGGATPATDPAPKPSWSSAIRPHARPKGLS